MNNNNTLATLLISSALAAWDAAQVRTNLLFTWTSAPDAVAELAHADHLNGRESANKGGSPALYSAVRAELAAQDRYSLAVERNQLRVLGLRIEREAVQAGQLALGL